MAEVKVNSVEPATVGPDMIAYLLTVSALSGSQYVAGMETVAGLPIITGFDENKILKTYAKCRSVVQNWYQAEKYIQD